MSGFFAILKRELLALFVTPLAWLVIAAFLLLQGIQFFVLLLHFANQQQIEDNAGPVPLVRIEGDDDD